MFTIFHERIVYLSFINSSSKNSSVEVEFYWKKIVNLSLHERPSEKKCVYLRLETCEENMRKKINAKSTFFAYKVKDCECMKKSLENIGMENIGI